MENLLPNRDLELLSLDHEPAPTLRKVRHALTTLGAATLPRLKDLRGEWVARWLYRTWLEQSNHWAPLLCVSRDTWAEDDLRWMDVVRGGWIYLGEGISPGPAWMRRAQECGAMVLQEGQDFVSAPQDWTNRLREMDQWHGVASDPGLSTLRRSLLSHCRVEATTVHLVGEAGSGKASLARWAHAQLDDRPLSELQGSQGRRVPGEWLLANQMGTLGEEQKAQLVEALSHQHHTPGRRFKTPSKPRPSHPALEHIVGQSASLTEVLEEVLLFAPSDLPVLIQGEPGVGKELLARALHRASGREGAFVALDMGAIPESLAESMLFGHKKGAFTGADKDRKGAFRSADGGTLFLDELGNMSPALQAKLLRALQEGQVQPLGSDAPEPVRVRVIAASNADIRSMVRRGLFREDLLGRLDTATLRVPSLRERLEDLDLLGRAFLRRAWGCEVPGPWCSREAKDALLQHKWPGNIRELENILRLAATLAAPGQTLEEKHLGPLSPRKRRRAPILTTHNTEDQSTWGLNRDQIQRLTLTSLRVPSLRDRPSISRRAAILEALHGRTITPEALRILEEGPWWGNYPELRTSLSALRHLPPGTVDLGALQQHMPHLAEPTGQAPIRTLLVPRIDAQDRITGLTQDFESNALLLGRISNTQSLQLASRAGDARSALWLRELKTRAGEGPVACLDLSLLPRLSRAHILVTRDPKGLCLHRMPGTRLPVSAASLEYGDETLKPLQEGEKKSLGRAAAVQVLSSSGRPYLEIFLFAGAVSYEEFSHRTIRQRELTRSLPHATALQTQAEPRAVSPPTTNTLRVWGLAEHEVEALNLAISSFRGGQLKQHVLLALPKARTPRLYNFLERAPRFSQYLVRLYELPENQHLRQDLRARLHHDPERDLRLSLLPRGLRRCAQDA